VKRDRKEEWYRVVSVIVFFVLVCRIFIREGGKWAWEGMGLSGGGVKNQKKKYRRGSHNMNKRKE